jgi:hypothetical protein
MVRMVPQPAEPALLWDPAHPSLLWLSVCFDVGDRVRLGDCDGRRLEHPPLARRYKGTFGLDVGYGALAALAGMWVMSSGAGLRLVGIRDRTNSRRQWRRPSTC